MAFFRRLLSREPQQQPPPADAYGGELGKKDCVIIASMGDELPNGTRVAKKTRAGTAFLPGTKADLDIVQDLIAQDSSAVLRKVYTDMPGPQCQEGKAYYLDKIKEHMLECKHSSMLIWYSGHGEMYTGDWVFKDGTIAFNEIFECYWEHFRGKLLYIVTDCCYSGQWVNACAAKLDELGIPPCGHRARERGIQIKVYASCYPDQTAADPCYSEHGVSCENGHLQFGCFGGKKLTDDQTTYAGDFTRFVCCREPENPCTYDMFQGWKWVDAVSGEMRRHIKLGTSKTCWYYVLLPKGKSVPHGREVDITKLGKVLIEGRGAEPPQEVQKRVRRWTMIT